jgi:hypothetical protein
MNLSAVGTCPSCSAAIRLRDGTLATHPKPGAVFTALCPGSGRHTAGTPRLTFRSFLAHHANEASDRDLPHWLRAERNLPAWLRDQRDLPAWLAAPEPPAWLTSPGNCDIPTGRLGRIAPRFGNWTTPKELAAELEARHLGALLGPSLNAAAKQYATWRSAHR